MPSAPAASRQAKTTPASSTAIDGLLGQSPALLALKQQMLRLAPTTATVLICDALSTSASDSALMVRQRTAIAA